MADEVPGLGQIGNFDHVAPGLMVFAVLLLVTSTSTSLAREAETGTLLRFRMARVPGAPMLAGVVAAQMTLAAVALAVMLAAAGLAGLDNEGSYLVAYAVLIATALFAVSLGVMVAGLARRREEAANISLLVALVAGFLSGAFFRMPDATLVRAGDVTVDAYDLLPTTHAVHALRAVLHDGAGLVEVAGDLAAILGLSAATLALGVSWFWARRLRTGAPLRTAA